jgi:hypothetical protein
MLDISFYFLYGYIMATWIKEFVMDLPLQPNGRMRMDCPACGKKNTFSVGEENGQRLFHCFHADCTASGRTGFRLTKEVATHPMLLKANKKSNFNLLNEMSSAAFEIPSTFVPITRSPESVAYLKRVHAYDAYLDGRVDLRFDFQRNRIVYMITNGRKVVDAAGRTLTGEKPKWWRYGKSGSPFVCGGGRVAVLVEDCASACCVSNVFSGVALLGTNLLDTHVKVLQNYDKVFVALDKDATQKALEIVRKLQGIVPTRLMILNQDLKDMDDATRERTLAEYA